MWKGIIIEESLNDKKVFSLVDIIKTRKTTLEKEKEKGFLTFQYIEIKDEKKDEFLVYAKNSIKNGFYIHICKGNNMIVIFQDRIFEFTSDEIDVLNSARKYGLSLGIIREQMPFELLINNPHK